MKFAICFVPMIVRHEGLDPDRRLRVEVVPERVEQEDEPPKAKTMMYLASTVRSSSNRTLPIAARTQREEAERPEREGSHSRSRSSSRVIWCIPM